MFVKDYVEYCEELNEYIDYYMMVLLTIIFHCFLWSIFAQHHHEILASLYLQLPHLVNCEFIDCTIDYVFLMTCMYLY